ncbi:MAG: hypothetical protein JF886_00650 [Candidatus Dormibacteraeota bacterium]|uniref:Tetratricopeptide repeat protein n=1 Tax=Candidatus Aeolococcus gillhamiae TaxID=3127015 RepID=A0A934JPU3_9BACT|nr:hypothetical protein [Candidatus Dormibacteraeota bacterium]
MIATNEALDVLRHGWQDAASTLAADVPEVAELLQARLEMAIATERLDEKHLLDTIQEVEAVTSRAGSPSSQELARRLRRTVYEYLLALDAARPLETAAAVVPQPASDPNSAMVGAEEVAALGHASRSRSGDAAELPPPAVEATVPELVTMESEASAEAGNVDLEDAVDDPASSRLPASRRRFALRRRQRRPADPASADLVDDEVIASDVPEAIEPAEAEAVDVPAWQFTPSDEPVTVESTLTDCDSDSDSEAAAVDDNPSLAADGPALTVDAGFVAPRAGFHIVEDAPAHRSTGDEEARLEMPLFSADEPAAAHAPARPGAAGTDRPGSEFLAWRPTGASLEPAAPEAAAPQARPAEAPVPSPGPSVATVQPALAPVANVLAQPAAAQPVPTPESVTPAPAREVPQFDAAAAEGGDAEPRTWGVRRQGEPRSPRRGAPSVIAAPVEDDPFENNSALSDIRRRIEERLRRKRCDEAAALLQELAQSTGGRTVADLAMNAGDRCRALGKSNAALNCYLAAARSDPVYEKPLSRLADICIDNQDTELAVSYLERIARQHRFRGEDNDALRVYRRIAAIAPYREDVLNMLMNAQRTGRLE